MINEQNNVYVLIHSPLVGGLTWTLVADQMRHRGLNVVIPLLVDLPDSAEPFWKQHAESVSQALAQIPKDDSCYAGCSQRRRTFVARHTTIPSKSRQRLCVC